MSLKFLQAVSACFASVLLLSGCATAAPIPTGFGKMEVGSLATASAG